VINPFVYLRLCANVCGKDHESEPNTSLN